jgi:hypothetical protein
MSDRLYLLMPIQYVFAKMERGIQVQHRDFQDELETKLFLRVCESWRLRSMFAVGCSQQARTSHTTSTLITACPFGFLRQLSTEKKKENAWIIIVGLKTTPHAGQKSLFSAMNRTELVTKAAYELVRNIKHFLNMEAAKTVCSQCAIHCFQTIETRNRLMKKQGNYSCLPRFVSEDLSSTLTTKLREYCHVRGICVTNNNGF